LIFDEGSTPETDYLRTLVWEELELALKELPEEQRFVFEQTELNGVSFKELSQQTGLPVNTLISRKRYAVLFLRERLLYLHDELLLF
jgi:DNA-directed RNA polymerase specialized sigma24 family protein